MIWVDASAQWGVNMASRSFTDCLAAASSLALSFLSCQLAAVNRRCSLTQRRSTACGPKAVMPILSIMTASTHSTA